VAMSQPVKQLDTETVFVDDECFRRIQWRSRRGLLENDLLLTQFLQFKEGRLSQLEHDGLAQLLELPDNELLDLILERQEPKDDLQTAGVLQVLEALRRLGDDQPGGHGLGQGQSRAFI
jgi:antitoxin CptB